MMFFSCVYSLYALLSKKHAKVMEHIKQAESSPKENSEGARHSDYVGILEIGVYAQKKTSCSIPRLFCQV